MIDSKTAGLWTAGEPVSQVLAKEQFKTDEETRWYAIESAILLGRIITQGEYDFYCHAAIRNNWPMTTLKPKIAGKVLSGIMTNGPTIPEPVLDKVPNSVYGRSSEANKIQHGGNHYKQFSKVNLEPWDVINAWGLGYFDGNALKYIARWSHKNGVEDLKKAVHYLQKLIEIKESK